MTIPVKTKPWIITVSVALIVLLYFVIIWLLVGEIDLMGNHYLIPIHQTVWSGELTNDNWLSLWNKYQWCLDCSQEEFKDFIGKTIVISTSHTYWNNMLLIYIFIGVAMSIVYPFFFRWFKIGNYDILPFSITTSLTCSIFILSALIPYWGSNNEFWREILRVGIFLVSAFIIFVFTNWLVNKFYITNETAHPLAYKLKEDKKSADYYNDDLKEMVKEYKKDHDKDYVDLDNPK